jgi:MEMO1 family protein
MNKALLFVGCLLIVLVIMQLKSDTISGEKTDKTSAVHSLNHFDKPSFSQGIVHAKKLPMTRKKIRGGVIPHHLTAGFIIADFFARIQGHNIKTIFVIGPNHKELGDFMALTSLYGWETPSGIVQPNSQVIQTLLQHQVVKVDERVVADDHSVAGIMPFIKHYFPQTKVVPVLLSNRMTMEDIGKFSERLTENVDDQSIVVAAVDFSHYLTSQQAKIRDARTLRAIKGFDYTLIRSLNNEYLDSPPSIIALMQIMNSLSSTNMEMLHNTNSGELAKDSYSPITSYFSFYYY